MALYTPLRLSLEGVFHDYDDKCYILFRPVMASEWDEGEKLGESKDTKGDFVKLVSKFFVSGQGKDDKGEHCPIELEDFKKMAIHLRGRILDTIRPLRSEDVNFTEASETTSSSETKDS